MKSLFARSLCVAFGLLGLVQPLSAADPIGSATLLPMPSTQGIGTSPLVSPTGYGGFQEEISPSDQRQPFAPPPPALSQDYQNAMKQAWDGAGAGACEEPAAQCCGRPCPRFVVWGEAMALGRINSCDRPVTLQGGTFQNIMGTNNTAQEWVGGFRLGGAWILPGSCCCNAISIGYWGLFPGDQFAYRNAPAFANGIRPVLGNIDRLDYNDGTTTDNVFNRMSTDTGRHALTTQSDFQGAEINFLGNTQAWGLVPFNCCNNCNTCQGCGGGNSCDPCNTCCRNPCWQFGWLGGFSYFTFRDHFLFQTDENDTVINQPGDNDELRYQIDTTNNLMGFQLGGQASWYICKCMSIYGGGRFGVYNNQVTMTQFVTGNAGDAVHNSGTNTGTAYRYSFTDNVLAGVGQLDVGLRYQLGCHWSMYGGYRVIAISGVATTQSQINENFGNAPDICATDSVLLHGGYLGVQFAW